MQRVDSTYRLQLSPQFTFKDLTKILEYLDELGVATIYSAPFFQAREGSTHGYDVLHPFGINTEIGDLKQFREIRARLKDKQITWLQDIVPNHMSFNPENPWIRDIFELGPKSRYYNYFDIDWEYKGLKKVMLPFFGNTLEELLEQKELTLKFDKDGFSLNYYESKYPLSARSYSEILKTIKEETFSAKFDSFPGNTSYWNELKNSFYQKIEKDAQLKKELSAAIEKINHSADEIQKILDLQYFLPTHWKHTEQEINYRRFFTINGLICIRMEDPEVFEAYHTFIKELCDEGLINGLRIDHIDGLFDPEGYLNQLRQLLGNEFFIIVEKILEADEKLPSHWPVEGTSGYEFLAKVNHLFSETNNENAFTEAYTNISPENVDYEALVYRKKLFILKKRMGGELHNLCSLLNQNLLPESVNIGKDETWKEALSVYLAAFPVYRIYPEKFPLKPNEKQILNQTYKKALEEFPEFKEELEYLKLLFMGEAGKDSAKTLYFLQRCQQFSGPLAAKGVEDTSFYIYNRLVAHNEVGDSPENFGITGADFHQNMMDRIKEFPLSLNATATHDTKRGEDSRMRLNVLSELPQEWFSNFNTWKEINAEIRENKEIPDINEEYFIYQTLIAGMPFKEESDFFLRICDFLQKVLREAKVHSNWAQPDEVYEKSVFRFVKDILAHKKFRDSLDPMIEKIAGFGVIKSLGQILIKITAPGIPDIYQGTELWDLSFVDPDNRRPVDYNLRMKYLEDFKGFARNALPQNLESLKSNYSSGQIKMFVMHTSLLQRRKDLDLFQKGEYIPLLVSGKNSEKFISYARVLNGEWRIIIVPLLIAELFNYKKLSPINEQFKDVFIDFPENAPSEWDFIFTNETIITDGRLALKDLFDDFPVVFLKNRN